VFLLPQPWSSYFRIRPAILSGFSTIIFLRGQVVSPTPNPQPGGPGLRIYDCRDRVAQLHTQAPGTHFSRIYDAHGLRWDYYCSRPPHGKNALLSNGCYTQNEPDSYTIRTYSCSNCTELGPEGRHFRTDFYLDRSQNLYITCILSLTYPFSWN
jgi:hypothetical protein